MSHVRRFAFLMLLSAGLFLSAQNASAVFLPGETLDPGCLPTDSTCIVTPSAVNTLNNLATTTLVNRNLLASTTATYDIGTSSTAWRNLYLSGLASTSQLTVSGTATSSFGGGINLSSGCFAIAGVCAIGGSAPSGLTDLGTIISLSTLSDQLAVGTSSVSGLSQLTVAASSTSAIGISVKGTTGQTGDMLRILSSADQTLFSVSANGSLLVNASTTLQSFTASSGTTTNATSTNFSATNLTANNLSVTSLLATNFAPSAIDTTNATATNATSTNLSVSSALTVSGSATLASLVNSGVSTLQTLTFTNATGTSATTTNFSTGVLTATTGTVGTLTNTTLTTSGSASLGSLLIGGSSTLQSFTAVNGTTTNATSTNFSATNLTATNISVASLSATNFTPAAINTTNATATNATSTNLSVSNALTVSGPATLATLLLTGSSTLQDATAQALRSSGIFQASSTALFGQGFTAYASSTVQDLTVGGSFAVVGSATSTLVSNGLRVGSTLSTQLGALTVGSSTPGSLTSEGMGAILSLQSQGGGGFAGKAALELAASPSRVTGSIADINFAADSNTTGKQLASIQANLEGSTSGNKGGFLNFLTKPDGGSLTERLRINSNGAVGIGTTSSSSAFAVAGSGVFAGDLSIANLNATGTATVTNVTVSGSATLANLLLGGSSTLQRFTFVNATGTSATTTNFNTSVLSATNASLSALALSAITSCTAGQALQTDASGNVSCGTITGGGSSSGGGWTSVDGLQSVTLSTTTFRVAVGASSTPYAKLSVISGSNGTTTLALLGQAGQTADVVHVYSGGVLDSVVTSAGNWGLGTTAPASKLSVSGNASISGSVSVGSLTATNATITSATATSLSVTNLSATNFTPSAIDTTNATATNATSTNLSVSNALTVSGPATLSTLLLTGSASLQGVTATNLTLSGSTTLQNVTAVNATTTNATTTNLASTNLSVSGATTLGVLTISGSASLGSLLANSSSTLQNITFTTATGTSATTTNFNATNLTATNVGATNITGTNATVTSLAVTSLSAANFAPTSLDTGNSTSTNATATNAFATNLSATNVSLLNATSTNLSVSGSGTSTFAGGVTAARLSADSLTVTGNATNTFANGFNISSGCFAVAGQCISGGSSASGFTDDGSVVRLTAVSDQVALGTTTASALSVLTVGSTATNTSAIVLKGASGTTASYLRVLSSTDQTLFAIGPDGAVSASGTSILANVVATNATITNATATNSFATNQGVTNLSVTGSTNVGTLAVSGSTTLQIFTAQRATVTSATSTSFFATTLQGVSGILNDLAVVSLTATNATVTNSTSTNLSVSGSGTSTFAGGVTAARLSADSLTITGNATNTFANGFNISSGCFAVAGQCISGGSSASGFTDDGSLVRQVTLSDQIAFGTTTPFGLSQLSIAATTSNSVGITIKGQISQSANLFRVLSFSDQALFTIASDGALFTAGSTTLQNFTARNSTTTNATTTSLAVSGRFTVTGSSTMQDLTLNANLNALGKIGIGTTTPQNNLHIQDLEPTILLEDEGGDAGVATTRIANSGGLFSIGTVNGSYVANRSSLVIDATDEFVALSGSNTPWASLSVNQDAGEIGFAIGSTTRTALIFDGHGRLGVGTSAPYATLSASGTVAFEGLSVLTASGDAVCLTQSEVKRNTGATSCTVSSRKYKHDINDLAYEGKSVLETLRALRPVSYKDNQTGIENIGFIAEEVYEIDPRLVFFETGSTTDTRGVKYEHVTSLLAGAIQELDARVTEGLARIATSTELSIAELDSAVISGGLEVSGHTLLGKDAVGETSITAGQTMATVSFETPYQWKPIMTVTPQSFVSGQFRVTNVTASGFSIELSEVQQAEVFFGWHAFAKKGVTFSEVIGASGQGGTGTTPQTTGTPDTEVPVITLNGNNPATITVGSSYVDLGAMVTDNTTNNINIVVTGDQIDTSVPGVHEVRYNATDPAGNSAVEVVRTVNVVSEVAPEPDPVPETAE